MTNDFYGPTLNSVEFLSPPKSLLLPGDEFSIKYSASDPSGISEAWIDYYYINPITGLAKPIEIYDQDLDGVINFKVNDEYWADGKYSLMYVSLVDAGGYRVTYTNAGIINGATQGSSVHDFIFSDYDVNVSNPKADVFGPILNNFTITGDFTRPFKNGDKVKINYDATDASGLYFVSFSWWWSDPITGTQRSKEFNDVDLDGLIEFTVGETPDMYGSKEWYTGTYKLFYVQLMDKAFMKVNEKNIVGYNFGGVLRGATPETSHNFDYSLYDINILSGEADTIGPTLKKIYSEDSLSAPKVVGDKVKIQYDAYDISGLSNAWLVFFWTNPVTGNLTSRDIYDENMDGVFELNIDKTWTEGKWELRYFNIVDNNLSSSDHNRVGYISSGIINGPSIDKTHQFDFSKFNFDVIADTQSPTLEIRSNHLTLNRGQSSNITFHFSENPGDFFLQNKDTLGLSVIGGVLSLFTSDTLNRYCVFTPDPNYIGTATIKLDKSTFSDLSGNVNLTPSFLEIKVDTVESVVINSFDNLYHFKGNKKIDGVVIHSQDLFGVSGVSSSHRYKITPTSENTITRENSSINLADVLSALKIYLGKNISNQTPSGFNYIAADFNSDGVVNLSDVLMLLKYYLGKNIGDISPKWSFVNAKDVLVTEGIVNVISKENVIIDRHNTKINDVYSDDANAADVSLVGVLRGDVDGSWSQ